MPRTVAIPCSACPRKFGGDEALKRSRVLAGDRYRCLTDSELIARNYYLGTDGVWHRGASLLPPTTATLFDVETPGASSHLPNPSDHLGDRDAAARRLIRLLGNGKAEIKGGHQVAAELGISQRAVGGVVHRAREMGVPVGSAHGEGYYIISSPAELEDTIAHIERRARGLRETVDLLRIGWEKNHVGVSA